MLTYEYPKSLKIYESISKLPYSCKILQWSSLIIQYDTFVNTHNIKFFLFWLLQAMLSLLHNLTQNIKKHPNNAINTFCFHAPRNLPYPHRVMNPLMFCDENLLNDLLQRSIQFYYSYTWSRNKMDICRCFYVLLCHLKQTSSCSFASFWDEKNCRQKKKLCCSLPPVWCYQTNSCQ